jgi:CRP/FNR family transcriptional regulator, cyclic AMP receptor protein
LLGSAVNAWLVPALIVVLLAVAIWFGLRWVRSENLDALAAIPLFAHLPRNRLMSILRSTTSVDFPPGTVIVEEGDRGKGFYVITRGTVMVAVAAAERASLSEGGYFGEISVIDGGPRSATLTAATRVSTLELTPGALRKVLDNDPEVAASIADQLRARLRLVGVQPAAQGSDRKTLEALCQEIRRTEQPEWAQAKPPRRSLGSVFARS